MKRILMALVVCLSMTSFVHAVPLFDVVETTYHIQGAAGVYDFAEYNQTSNSPLEAMIEYEHVEGSPVQIHGIARPGYLYTSITDGNEWVSANAKAWSETVFNPLFDGSGPVITFYHSIEYPYGNNEITITDDTLGTVIFNAEWDIEPDPRLYAFDYDEWDMDHTYTLRMALWGGTNAIGFPTYEMGTNFPIHTDVPEPVTVSALFFTLIGLVGLKRKFMKDQ